MGGINIFCGGIGGSARAYDAVRSLLQEETHRPTVVIPSLRFGEPMATRGGNATAPALDRQARNLADATQSLYTLLRESEGGGVHVYAHSLGVPIAAMFAARFQKELDILSFTGICPAGIYEEPFFGLGLKILRKVSRDLTVRPGRKYWVNSVPYFLNLPRSLKEGWEISRNPVTAPLLRALQDAGVRVRVGLTLDDDVFSFARGSAILDASGIQYSLVTTASRHSPDFEPEKLVACIKVMNTP